MRNMYKTFPMNSTASRQTDTDPTQFYDHWRIYVGPSANRTGQYYKHGQIKWNICCGPCRGTRGGCVGGWGYGG